MSVVKDGVTEHSKFQVANGSETSSTKFLVFEELEETLGDGVVIGVTLSRERLNKVCAVKDFAEVR
ncbi:hypothetical protein FACS1894217_04480 [Clostridia bacterium]|nr:hypothetical protein FACS1894217_04480 [Clostridia bacterium]